jgi:hypothetical protein
MNASRRVLLFLVIAAALRPALAADGPAIEEVRAALTRGVEFLLKDQNPDGSWGSHRNAVLGLDDPFMNAPSQKAFIVGTTALGCLAMAEAEPTSAVLAAYDRGIDYLINNAFCKRISAWDIDNTWAFVYGLTAAVDAYVGQRYSQQPQKREALADVIRKLLEKFKAYQTPLGGWGYYDSGDTTTHPPNWATSFMTAAAVLGMLDARKAGFDVDEAILGRAVKAIRRCRLPTGAYTYSLDQISTPGWSEGINNVKGSLGRIQVCNLALRRYWQQTPPDKRNPNYEVTDERLKRGLEQFFREHRFLDIARGRPIPHEAYYANAAYFYFFGHFYAAQVIEELPREERERYWARYQREVTKTQESDGSMWDYPMNSYGKPYGTSFAVMGLKRSLSRAEEPVAR